MDLPIRFPRDADTIFAEAQAFRRLTPTERILSMLDLIASGMILLEQSPHREARVRLQQESEAQWQQIQKELFARHVH